MPTITWTTNTSYTIPVTQIYTSWDNATTATATNDYSYTYSPADVAAIQRWLEGTKKDPTESEIMEMLED